MAKKLSDIPELQSWSSLPRIKFEELIDKEMTIEDVSWREGDEGDYAIIKFYLGNDAEPSSTACGGAQIVETLKKAIELHALPITATVRASDSKKFKGKKAYRFE